MRGAYKEVTGKDAPQRMSCGSCVLRVVKAVAQAWDEQVKADEAAKQAAKSSKKKAQAFVESLAEE